MVKIISMQLMRYLNLFEKISRVRTKDCLIYNSSIIFAVPKNNVSKAIGENGKNVKKIEFILNRKVKVVALPDCEEDAERFILAIVHPNRFKSLAINEKEIIINAGSQSKAILIGKGKMRLHELKEIIKEYFKKELRIV